ncbi:ABC transporter permease [Kribbia dieselivorans]|uniref:ABC transporter permease n=1 Tax=Kribbia dieselivorans TaxID=331526 RepID=UPI000837B4B7|nr:ABC transporter permease [Kribbia dieselivorans]
MTAVTEKRAAARAAAPATRRSGLSITPLTFVIGLTPLVLVLVGWQVFGDPVDFTFPPPSTWWEATKLMWASGELPTALTRTLWTFALGLVFSVVLGTALGWLIGASKTVDRALSPLLDFFRSMPSPAIVPVATIVFGVTIRMSVVVMVLALIWPVLLAVASSRQNIPTVRLEMGRVLGLSGFDRMRKVVLPSLLPAVMTGTRVVVSQGFVVALLIDIIGAGAGIGRLLVVRQQSFDAAAVWALLVIIGLAGLVANLLVSALDNRVQRGWRS